MLYLTTVLDQDTPVGQRVTEGAILRRPYNQLIVSCRGLALNSLFVSTAAFLFVSLLFQLVRMHTGATYDLHPFPWDAGWYRNIIEQGYSFNGNILQQQNIAFSPLYPLLCWVLHAVLGIETAVCMYIVSGISFWLVLFGLHKLVSCLLSPALATATVLVYSTNPFSFFNLFGYGDVTFICAAVWAIYFLEIPRRLGAATACVALGCIAKAFGPVLVIPLLAGILRHQLTQPGAWSAKARNAIRPLITYMPLATLPYSIYAFVCSIKYHAPLAFLHDLQAWYGDCFKDFSIMDRLQLPNALDNLSSLFSHDIIYPPGIGLLFLLTGTLLYVVFGLYRSLPLSLNMFLALTIAVIVWSGSGCNQNAFLPVGRYVLSCFPLSIAIAVALRGRTEAVLQGDNPTDTLSEVAPSLVLAAINIVVFANYVFRFWTFQWVA